MRPRTLAAVSAGCAALAAGSWLAFAGGSTAPSAVTEGQTLIADPSTMVDTAKAITLIDSSKVALCKTTISGVSYFSNPSAYVGGQWYQALSALTLAQTFSPSKSPYDTAGNALRLTTITGKRYCTTRPAGQWSLAFATLASERADLVANPANDGPSIR